MKILITGCAGFIGFHTANFLLKNSKHKIFGFDNLNSYYDVNLKKQRLKILKENKNFIFYKIDIKNKNLVKKNFNQHRYDIVIHLAAQAGVRYSIINPQQYLDDNIIGFFNIIDSSNDIKLKHFIYASTSSVYGNQNNFPLKEEFDTNKPLSFYAATKKCNEILAYSYSNIHKLPCTGLRFFTVYGPYGRPDMSLFKFTKNIIEKKNIKLFNHGRHVRDFTYIDDVINYINKILTKPSKKNIPYSIYNISSNNPKNLSHFINLIEKKLTKKSKKINLDLQQGDTYKTHGDINLIYNKTKYIPTVSLKDGIDRFINWYKKFYK